MLRLMIIFALACIASVRCGTVLAPVLGKLVSEKTVESHGSDVVHASAPLIAAAAPLKYANLALVQQPIAEIVPKAALITEKTLETHGHTIVHDARPLIAVAKPLRAVVEPHVAIPARELAYAEPIYYSTYPHLIAEKTVSNYGHSVQHLA